MKEARIDRMSMEDVAYYRNTDVGIGAIMGAHLAWVQVDRVGRQISKTALEEVGGVVAKQHREGVLLEVKTRTVARVVRTVRRRVSVDVAQEKT